MEKVLALRPEISRVAAAVAPPRRSWAVVGSGPDRVAAAEVRIKLSELCYKAIGIDSIEDKKHIDLSAEPLIIVCASSVSGPNAHDIAKEVEIFRAHKAAPVVIVAEGQEGLFSPGVDVLAVPACHTELAFVLAAMVGHIFGYEAALSIDGQAQPLRQARALLESASGGGPAGAQAPGAGGHPKSGGSGEDGFDLEELAPALETLTAPALAGLRSGTYDGHLNASTAAQLTSLLRYATGALPVEGYEAEMGKVGTPRAIAADLIDALGTAIDELTRPVDAIKHQAKTVTVGISRSEETLVRAKLVVDVLATGSLLESLGYRALRTLAALGPGVEEVLGFTRYHIEAGARSSAADPLDGASITVVDRGGIAAGIVSRTAGDGTLRGTKHRTAEKREVTVFKGLHDGRTGVMVPEVKDGQVTGITLLHARFADRLEPGPARALLAAYQGRYAALVDAVTEAHPHFDDQVLGRVPLIELLTEPVAILARHWASSPGAA
jgi:glutamine---fructose-6-phosphate transaminase (isomerizing)